MPWALRGLIGNIHVPEHFQSGYIPPCGSLYLEYYNEFYRLVEAYVCVAQLSNGRYSAARYGNGSFSMKNSPMEDPLIDTPTMYVEVRSADQFGYFRCCLVTERTKQFGFYPLPPPTPSS